jgi:hypothetical protein
MHSNTGHGMLDDLVMSGWLYVDQSAIYTPEGRLRSMAFLAVIVQKQMQGMSSGSREMLRTITIDNDVAASGSTIIYKCLLETSYGGARLFATDRPAKEELIEQVIISRPVWCWIVGH